MYIYIGNLLPRLHSTQGKLVKIKHFLRWFEQSSPTSWDIMELQRKCTAKKKKYSYLVIDANLSSDNPLCFSENLLEEI